MHDSVLSWVHEKVHGRELRYADVLEAGSQDVNGSARQFFRGDLYVGIDMQKGKGVDIVGDAARAKTLLREAHQPLFYDVALYLETAEHDPHFWLTVETLADCLTDGGYLLMTTRGIGFPFHEFPADYWRFTLDGVRALVEPHLHVIELLEDPQEGHPGVFCLATKTEEL